MNPFRLSILLTACFASSLLAQEKPKEPAHSVRFICVEPADGAENLILAEKTEKGWEARHRFSATRGFMGSPLALATRYAALAIDPSPVSTDGSRGRSKAVEPGVLVQPFTTFELPAAGSASLILIPEAGSSKKYRTLVLETADGGFGAGQILVYNLTKGAIGGKFGGKTLQLPSGLRSIITPGVDQPGDMAQITIGTKVGNGYKTFCDTRWPAKPDFRRYLLLLPKADGGATTFVMPEFPPFH